MHNSPVRERIVLADALRGFALMGLFIVHMVEYFELYWYKPEPGWIHNLIFFLFGGKAYGVFALLFGLSFYIILDNYAKRGIDFRARFIWRISLLLGFGYIHSLLYAGDILQLLALCGFLLVVCHRLGNFWIAVISAFFLIQIPQLLLIIKHSVAPNPDYIQPAFWNLMGSNFEMFAKGSFTELVHYNLIDGQKGKWAFFYETGRLWNIAGLMFVGVLLGRTGFFEKQHDARKLLLFICFALGVFIVLKFSSAYLTQLFKPDMPQWCANELFAYYQNLSIICIEVLLFVLAFQTKVGERLLRTFAPPGRLTLSFYIFQSVIFVPAYYGFGLAWYTFIGQTWSLILGIIFWLLQMYIAALYLQHFRYGPLEWLWRKATFYPRFLAAPGP